MISSLASHGHTKDWHVLGLDKGVFCGVSYEKTPPTLIETHAQGTERVPTRRSHAAARQNGGPSGKANGLHAAARAGIYQAVALSLIELIVELLTTSCPLSGISLISKQAEST